MLLWLGGLVLLATGVLGVWWTVTKTDYLPKLAVWLMKQLLPILMKRKSPEEEALDRQDVRENRNRNEKPGSGGRNN